MPTTLAASRSRATSSALMPAAPPPWATRAPASTSPAVPCPRSAATRQQHATSSRVTAPTALKCAPARPVDTSSRAITSAWDRTAARCWATGAQAFTSRPATSRWAARVRVTPTSSLAMAAAASWWHRAMATCSIRTRSTATPVWASTWATMASRPMTTGMPTLVPTTKPTSRSSPRW